MFEAVLYFLMEMLHIEYDLVNGIQRSYNYNTKHFFMQAEKIAVLLGDSSC